MVVCKFYLQGTCKFGNNCRFEHDASGGQHHGSSILRQQQPQANQTQLDQNVSVRSVVADSLAAEQGKQWMLSCYAPYKDKRPFPGFEDRSFEEVRHGFLEATNNGTLEQFKQEFNALYQDAINRVKMLQHPSPNVVDFITQEYGAPSKNPEGHEQVSRSILSSNYGQTNAPSIFGGGQNSGSIFGNNQSVFGQTPSSGSVFGQNTGASIFNQGNAQSPFGQSVFGQTPNVGQSSTSIFGQNPSPNSGSIFGQNPSPNAAQNTNSIFGQNPSVGSGQNPTSIFGQNQGPNIAQNSIFGQTPVTNPVQNSSSIFGQNPALSPGQNSGSIFGQNVTNQPVFAQGNTGNSIFGQSPTNASSIFGNPNPNAPVSVFGQNAAESTATQPSVFGNVFTQNKPTEQPIQQNQSPFGNPAVVPLNVPSPFGQNPNPQPTTIFGGPQGHSASIFGQRVGQNVAASERAAPEMLGKLYSKLAELGEDDTKCFEAAMFEFGKIPEIPPPYELCF